MIMLQNYEKKKQSRVETPADPERSWNRFTTILLDQEMDFKKNPIEKFQFVLEKNLIWKKSQKYFRKF